MDVIRLFSQVSAGSSELSRPLLASLRLEEPVRFAYFAAIELSFFSLSAAWPGFYFSLKSSLRRLKENSGILFAWNLDFSSRLLPPCRPGSTRPPSAGRKPRNLQF